MDVGLAGLADRARAGDREAFASLAAALLPRAHAVASLVLRDRDLADDAVQEAFVQAWRHIRGLREPDRIEAWVHRLVVRSCYQQVRRNRRRTVAEIRVIPIGEPLGSGPEPSTALRDELERGFRRLPVGQRAVLVLHHYLGLTLDETAVVLEIPPGTARSRLNRAMASMRAALEADARVTSAAQESYP